MAPTLYAIHASPPCRTIYLCAKAIGLDLNIKTVNLLNMDHLKPEYLKINPQHTVPLLDDDGFILPDSHAIMTYLVSKYAKGSALYPQDLKQRAIIDHKLHFDSSTLFARGAAISKSIILEGETDIDSKKLDALEDAYATTEKFLEKTPYIAGDQITVADFSFVTSLTAFQILLPISEAKYPKITAYIKKLEKLPYYKECNQAGLDEYLILIKTKLAK